jgi:hypothetical protein
MASGCWRHRLPWWCNAQRTGRCKQARASKRTVQEMEESLKCGLVFVRAVSAPHFVIAPDLVSTHVNSRARGRSRPLGVVGADSLTWS